MNPEVQAALQLLSMLVADPRTGLLIGLLIAAAWSDYGTGRIPNLLVFCGTLAGLAYNTLAPQYHVSAELALLLALGGMACGFAATLPFYLLRAMGAGDVKLMAMCGAFLSYPDTLWAICTSFLAGGALSFIYLLWKGSLRRAVHNITLLLFAFGAGSAPTLDAATSAGTLPFGIAIALGTIGYLALRQFGLMH